MTTDPNIVRMNVECDDPVVTRIFIRVLVNLLGYQYGAEVRTDDDEHLRQDIHFSTVRNSIITLTDINGYADRLKERFSRPKPDRMKQRLGRFQIQHATLTHNPATALSILKDCIPVRAETLFHTDNSVEYVAMHPDFDIVLTGYDVPTYSARMETKANGDVIRIGWSKLGLT